MKPVILFRKTFDIDTENEFLMCKDFFTTVEYRSDIPRDSFVICRYSSLPYFDELYYDLCKINSISINTPDQYKYIANFSYYDDIKEFTFPTWFDSFNLPEGEFVVKGKTNSRKHQWNSLMFAKNRSKAIEIGCELLYDPLISSQGVIYRKYVPLETFEIGINDLPMTNEWRLFYFKNKLLCYGYYWTSLDDVSKFQESVEQDLKINGLSFAQNVAEIISKKVNFFVLDIAKTQSNEWILVEINDGQMAGLSFCDPKIFYKNLNFEISKYIES